MRRTDDGAAKQVLQTRRPRVSRGVCFLSDVRPTKLAKGSRRACEIDFSRGGPMPFLPSFARLPPSRRRHGLKSCIPACPRARNRTQTARRARFGPWWLKLLMKARRGRERRNWSAKRIGRMNNAMLLRKQLVRREFGLPHSPTGSGESPAPAASLPPSLSFCGSGPSRTSPTSEKA